MFLRLSIHGITVSIRAPKPFHGVIEKIRSDYHAFVTFNTSQSSDIRIFLKTSLNESLPPHWSFRTRYSRSRGWSIKEIILDRTHRILIRGNSNYLSLIEGTDSQQTYEMLDRVLLSSIGEQLDLKGIHRVHAFSFQNEGKNVIVCAPSGNGKSYLAQLANQSGCAIYSDEVTLIRAGRMLAFPMNLSQAAGESETFIQRKGGPKKMRIAIQLHPDLRNNKVSTLVLARRTYLNDIKVQPASVWQKLEFILETGLGVGQMQMIEFTIRKDHFFNLPKIFISRVRNAYRLINECEVLSIGLPNHLKWKDFARTIEDSRSKSFVGIPQTEI